MQVALQNVALPARLRPPVPLSDEELMAFSEANKPCRVERLASGEILVMTPSGYKNNLREAYVVHELFLGHRRRGADRFLVPMPASICPTAPRSRPMPAGLSQAAWLL